ncbi:hypothetical protein C3L33_00606, partial [Rhododendron williamsianum]
MSGAGKVVCVTGASGYIASWIVKLLLDRGYTVKGTVPASHRWMIPRQLTTVLHRSSMLGDPKKVDHLLSLHGAKERLQLFKANLMEEGSFDSVVDGCEGVFHTASPVLLESSNPQGGFNIFHGSVAFNNRPRNPDVVIDETWFSDPVYCEESKDLMVSHRYVDVRDVALAHILAYEVSSASGRYCLVGTVTNSSEAVNILHKLYPALKLPERPEDGKPAEPLYQVSKKKAESLGIHFTPLEVTLRDTVESLKEKNFLQF